MRLDQASLLIGREWKGTSDTVGAFIVERLGRLPEPGEEITIDGIDVEIEVVESDTVMTIIVGSKPKPEAERA
jgi:CBS domain containing-hemolysin-like protein